MMINDVDVDADADIEVDVGVDDDKGGGGYSSSTLPALTRSRNFLLLHSDDDQRC